MRIRNFIGRSFVSAVAFASISGCNSNIPVDSTEQVLKTGDFKILSSSGNPYSYEQCTNYAYERTQL